MKNKFVETRYLDLDDIEQIVEFDKSMTKKEFAQILSESNVRGIVAEEGDNNIVGYAIIDLGIEDVFTVKKLVIRKEFRRNGFGTALLEACLKVKKVKRPESLIEIYINEKDLESAMFYKYHGYKGSLVRDYYYGSDGIKFIKPVQASA